MFQQNYLSPIRSICCFIHKKQKASHICTDLQCINNPILCILCLNDPKYRGPHLNHQPSIKLINQGIQYFANCIKKNIKSNEEIYEKTLGGKDNHQYVKLKNTIFPNLTTIYESTPQIFEQIQLRLNNIKTQIDLEIQLLVKEFQKQILLEKQQFIKKIDNYKRIFYNNLQTIRKQGQEIIIFEQQLKYYCNSNTLLLKLSTESQKNTLDWFMMQKKVLSKVVNNNNININNLNNNMHNSPQKLNQLSSNNYNSSSLSLSSHINQILQMNMLSKPIWNGIKKELQNQKQFKLLIKNNIDNWVILPQLWEIGDGTNGGYIERPGTGGYANSNNSINNTNNNINNVSNNNNNNLSLLLSNQLNQQLNINITNQQFKQFKEYNNNRNLINNNNNFTGIGNNTTNNLNNNKNNLSTQQYSSILSSTTINTINNNNNNGILSPTSSNLTYNNYNNQAMYPVKQGY